MSATDHRGSALAPSAGRSSFVRAWSMSTTALASLLAVQAVVLWWQLRDHAFVFDDVLYMVLARATPDRWTWLTSDYFQHVAPLHRLWWTAQQHVDPFGYRLALAAGILGVVVGTALFKRGLDLLFGRRPLHLGLTALVAFSVLWIRHLQWWSAGLQMVPTFVSGMVVLVAYGSWLATGRARWLVVGGAAMTFGLLFYELPVGILGALVLFRVLVLHDDLRPVAVLRLLIRERAALLAFGAPVLVYVVWYSAAVTPDGPGGALGPAVFAELFRRTWLETLVPSLFGVVLDHDGSATEVVLIVLCQVAFWAIVGWTVWRRGTEAVRVWVWLGLIVVVKLTLVGLSRLPFFDPPTVANDPRYVGELAFLWPLALAALLRPPGAGLAGRLRHERLPPGRPMRPPAHRVGAMAALLATSVIVAVHFNAVTIDGWPGEHARRYQRNAELLLRSLPPGGVILDGPVPHFVIPLFATGYNTTGRFLALYDVPVQIDGPVRDGGLFVLGPDGNGVAVDIVPRAGGPATEELRRGNLRAATATHDEHAVCVGPTAGAPTVLTLALPAGSALPDPYVHMTYTTDASYTVEVRADTGAGMASFPTTGLTVASDTMASVAWLRSPGSGAITSLRFDVPPDQRLCIERLELVELVPTG